MFELLGKKLNGSWSDQSAMKRKKLLRDRNKTVCGVPLTLWKTFAPSLVEPQLRSSPDFICADRAEILEAQYADDVEQGAGILLKILARNRSLADMLKEPFSFTSQRSRSMPLNRRPNYEQRIEHTLTV
jgi:hypothetical protein